MTLTELINTVMKKKEKLLQLTAKSSRHTEREDPGADSHVTKMAGPGA